MRCSPYAEFRIQRDKLIRQIQVTFTSRIKVPCHPTLVQTFYQYFMTHYLEARVQRSYNTSMTGDKLNWKHVNNVYVARGIEA